MIEGKTGDPRFILALREDDAEILIRIRGVLGFGRLVWCPRRGATNPAIQFRVQGLRNCMKLVQVLDRFPLRSKKRIQYEIWSAAIKAIFPSGRTKRLHRLTPDLKQRLLEAHSAMAAHRAYAPLAATLQSTAALNQFGQDVEIVLL